MSKFTFLTKRELYCAIHWVQVGWRRYDKVIILWLYREVMSLQESMECYGNNVILFQYLRSTDWLITVRLGNYGV